MPILQDGVDGSIPTGWELCADGRIHRAQIVACEDPLPRGESCSLEDQGCAVDADCGDGPHGRCIEQSDFADAFCYCQYGCESDADCDVDEVCTCAGDQAGYPSTTRCMPATCDEDASCGGELCALGSGDDGCGTQYAVACTNPADECISDMGCDADCFPDGAVGHWTCQDFCCCGRPLLVDGCPVTAAVVRRGDWTTEAESSAERVPTMIARRIAEHWTQAGQLEHASVASFARFTLELMGQGAPPELLVRAQQAGLDEIDHARRCFALATEYAGQPVGPGALAVHGAEPARTLEAVVGAVIDEACVGETLAAVEARAALVHATCPAVRETLEVIAADEERHAALGWATLRWALDQADAGMRGRLVARLREAIEKAGRARPVAMVDHDRAWLRAYGVLDPADRRRAHGEAIEQVLRPCLMALEGAQEVVAALA